MGLVIAFSVASPGATAQSTQLQRLDSSYGFGYWNTGPYAERFGTNRMTFGSGPPSQTRIPRDTDFGFSWANNSVTFNGHFVNGNTCVLVNNFGDTLIANFARDTLSEVYEDCIREIPSSFFQQVFLPLDENTFVYTVEHAISNPDWRSEWSYTTQSHDVFYLDAPRGASAPTLIDEAVVDFPDTLLEETLDYVSAGDGLGWIGIARSATDSDFHLWRVDLDSVSYLNSQTLGPPGFRREKITTRLRFNPAGTAFAISGTDDGLHLYHFDRNTLAITPWTIIPPDYDPEFVPYRTGTDCEWSACGRYLYVTTIRHVYQFDTQAADVAGSAVLIDEQDAYPSVVGFYEIERAPDCRLYLTWPGSARALSVIDEPSLPGRACALQPVGMELETINFAGMSNHPNYALWARDRIANGMAPIVDTATCDATLPPYAYIDITVSTQEPGADSTDSKDSLDVDVMEPIWSVYPNPASVAQRGGVLYLGGLGPLGRLPELHVELIDAVGHSAGRWPLAGSEEVRELRVPAGLAAGVYVLVLTDGGGAPLGQRAVVVE